MLLFFSSTCYTPLYSYRKSTRHPLIYVIYVNICIVFFIIVFFIIVFHVEVVMSSSHHDLIPDCSMFCCYYYHKALVLYQRSLYTSIYVQLYTDMSGDTLYVFPVTHIITIELCYY
ncbi:hypothetical protein FKM82_021697 [Ascaphus truei]